MITDLSTVLWKEWTEFKSRTRGASSLVFLGVIVLAGIAAPLQAGPALLTSWFTFIPIGALLLFAMPAQVVEAFAGERERHTLEALLATPLSDAALLFGKFFASLIYGFVLAASILLLALVVVNVTHPGHGLLTYPPIYAFSFLSLGLLIGGLVSAAGVHVSLRAQSVRQANQTLYFAIGITWSAGFIIPQVVPDAWKSWVLSQIASAGIDRLVLVAVGALTVIDVVLILTALARFRRGRLLAG
jgi:ABC-2 type transport system permease protein